jgi:hypothetical protein
VSLIDALTDFDFYPIQSTDGSQPSIRYDPFVEGVMNLDVTILRTTDDSVPSKIYLSIFGCAEPAPSGSKPAVESTTPSAPTMVTQSRKTVVFIECIDVMNPIIV